jgi:purine-binding chemotaxis protein CheW
MATQPELDALAGKYLTFHLAGEEYGLPILRVQEIISMPAITRVPRTRPAIRGVTNLRGKVLSAFDLRVIFGLPPAEKPEQVVIVVQVAGEALGVIADQVSEVTTFAASELELPPSIGAAADNRHLLALGKAADGLRLLLDIDRVVAGHVLPTSVMPGADGARAADAVAA